jgi:hypothetical protein
MGGVVESEKGNVKKGECQRCYVRGVGWRRLCLRQLGVRWFSRFLFVGFSLSEGLLGSSVCG